MYIVQRGKIILETYMRTSKEIWNSNGFMKNKKNKDRLDIMLCQSKSYPGFRIRIRIRMFLACPDPHKFADPDPGKKVRKWMNKSLFCRVGDVQCKQFHFFCSDFKHPLLRIIWNVKKTPKKIHFSLYHRPPPPDTPRIRIRMKIFARIRIRKKKCGSETLVLCKKQETKFARHFTGVYVPL